MSRVGKGGGDSWFGFVFTAFSLLSFASRGCCFAHISENGREWVWVRMITAKSTRKQAISGTKSSHHKKKATKY